MNLKGHKFQIGEILKAFKKIDKVNLEYMYPKNFDCLNKAENIIFK
jgi:hypothetical protein